MVHTDAGDAGSFGRKQFRHAHSQRQKRRKTNAIKKKST